MLTLVVNNEWTLLNQASTDGVEIYHKTYKDNLHGMVFLDNEGGNSILMDSENNIIDMQVSSMCDFYSLQKICDNLTNKNTKAV